MKKKTLALLACLLAVCMALTTAVFAADGKGQLRSDTGTALNLRLDWAVSQPGGASAETISVTVVLEHYALYVGARTVTFSIGENKAEVLTDAIHSDDNSVLQQTALGAYEVPLDRAAGETIEVPIAATWTFNGTYAGKQIGTLTVAQTLVISDSGVTVREGTGTPSAPAAPSTPATPAQTVTEPEAVGGPAYSRQWTLRSDNGTWLNLVCEVQAADSLEEAGKLDGTAVFYLEYYSLWMSEKTGTATIGGQTITLHAPAVAEESNTQHRVVLGTATFICAPGERLSLHAALPFYGTYSGKPLAEVLLSGEVTFG